MIRKFVDSGVRTVHAEGVARGAINSEVGYCTALLTVFLTNA